MKIPKQAKRVFKGVIFDVYQWEQEMFDGSKETFEMLKRPDTAVIIPVQGDKIFLNQQEQPGKPPFLSFFGGRADEGEEALTAAKRELLEESGLASDDWELFNSYEPLHKIQWGIHYFIARNCRKVAEPKLDAGEKIEILSVDFDEFVEIATSPEMPEGEFTCDMLRLKLENKLEELKKKLWTQAT